MDPTGFVFGIRVNKSFYIEDKLGAIVDDILYSKDTEFGPSVFPIVQEQGSVKILCNDKNTNRFIINHSDFIFEYSIRNDFDTEFTKYLNSFVSVVTKAIFKKHGIGNIARFGFIVKAQLNERDEITQAVHTILSENYPKFSADSYSLRFNVKEKKPLTIQNVITEDFDNVIVTYDRATDTAPLMLSVDYQKYFKPELNVINEAPQSFDSFCIDRLKLYRKTYLKEDGK